MRLLTIVPRLLASAVMLCACGAAQAQQNPVTDFGTPKFEGKQVVGSGAVAIEATLLASTAVDAAAAKIADHVNQRRGTQHVLVIGGAESIDFGQVAMIQTEMSAIQRQLLLAMTAPPSNGKMTGLVLPPVAAIIPALAGMMRSDTEYSAVDVTLDARILPSAVAAKLGENVTLFSAKVGANSESKLLSDFDKLGTLAGNAQILHDVIAGNKDATDQEKGMVPRLAAALKRYDAFFNRVTTGTDKGVPLAGAARLAQMIETKPLILRVNIEKVGGTTVKRTNLLTFFGADGLSISGGLVASYQLTEPESGRVEATGVVICRTALTKLKSVQDSTWKARGSHTDNNNPDGQTAVCRGIGQPPIKDTSSAGNGR